MTCIRRVRGVAKWHNVKPSLIVMRAYRTYFSKFIKPDHLITVMRILHKGYAIFWVDKYISEIVVLHNGGNNEDYPEDI